MKQDLIIQSDLLPEFVETNLQYSSNSFKIPTTEDVKVRPVRRKTTGILVQYSIEHKKTVSKSTPKPI